MSSSAKVPDHPLRCLLRHNYGIVWNSRGPFRLLDYSRNSLFQRSTGSGNRTRKGVSPEVLRPPRLPIPPSRRTPIS